MTDAMISLWFWLGIVLVLAEFILPGLVVVFVGMAALTVALLVHLEVISSFPAQLAVWFGASIGYTLSLRFLVLRFYPTDTVSQFVESEAEDIGQIATVIETIGTDGTGRVSYGESTWPASTSEECAIEVGEEVRIVARENISLVVEKV